MQNQDLLEISQLSDGAELNVADPERVVSAVAGGALIAFGIKHGGWLGASLSLLGGGLLHRGATGHCYIYDAVGVNTNDPAKSTILGKAPGILSGTVHVKKAATVNRSPA